ncbi:MFS transporter [Pradoshia sp. D12]|uniref:MFS transporter n=1 Tax=Bacillaceae TaxID=186817 RepID=UPI0011203489|nr:MULTISPECIES: MFS transporter [Bacillaceae]QFK71917.1 MFS transporter [Pradoshia sp. D12]TPF73711.1 MFS transporter [Bacillus sp. D12]
MAKAKSTAFLKFLIVLIAFQDVAAGVAGSIMADLIKAFPNYNPSVVMLIATIPGFFQIIPSLLYGKLANKYSKRGLLFTGLAFFIIGGIMPFFIDNLFLIIAFRGLLGLGVGITLPLSVDIITSFFDGRDRDFLIGLGTSTVACIGAIFFQVVGGMLADAYNWQFGFLVYLFPILILALTFLYLPEPKKQEVHNASFKEILFSAPKTVYGFTIGQVIFTALVFGYVTNISIIIQAENLGNATEAGFAISLFTFGTLVVGLFFGPMRQLWPNFNIPFGILLTAVGILWCYYANTLMMINMASFLGGMGLGIVIPGVLARVSELSNLAKGISFVGFAAAAQGLGGITSSFMYQFLLNITGQENGRFTLLLASIGLFLLAIAWSAVTTLIKEKDSQSNATSKTTHII